MGAEGYNHDDILLSARFGTRITLPGDLSLRISWGIPLMRNKFESAPTCGRVHFELSLSPDFDALVKLRKPKTEKL